jgi:hypothetical protein
MSGRALALGVSLLWTVACSTVGAGPNRSGAAAVPAFMFGADTFGFVNDVRALNPDKKDLYANYCFVLARGVRQFHTFARFDPTLPRLDGPAYQDRVRRVVARAAWEPALPPDDRIVIPGYRNLHEFSRDQEAVVKAALGPRFWTFVHWTNWRVVRPVSEGHQTRVADEIAAELDSGHLVQLLVTNWPIPELNHTVVAYAYRTTDAGVDFTVYDPNDIDRPGTITFERASGRFWATQLPFTRPGLIRAFRMYYSRLL